MMNVLQGLVVIVWYAHVHKMGLRHIDVPLERIVLCPCWEGEKWQR